MQAEEVAVGSAFQDSPAATAPAASGAAVPAAGAAAKAAKA